MRNKNRIAPFCNELATIWKEKFPDWRFGQLMYNFIAEVGDPFYLEEDVFLKKLKEYADTHSKWG